MDIPLAGFRRTLTPADSKQNLPFPVTVPEGTTRLDLRLTFAPPAAGGFNNLLTLSLFDPSGWRGAGHRQGSQHDVSLGPAHASPGYVAGPIPAGEWTVVVDTHLVMPGPPCKMQLEIRASDEPVRDRPVTWPPAHTAPRGAGWYRGDLHAHSIHSDAAWDIPDLLAWARDRRLDFCTLSDHNTISGLARMDASSGVDLLTMGGMELTTFWGHALALGLREWVDWRTRPGERTMDQIAVEVGARGGLFIIAHPTSVGDPDCTGCRWLHETVRPGPARVVEVWNGPWLGDGRRNNEEALALAYGWMNAGCRLALSAGTDNHGRETPRQGFTVAFAQELSQREVLRAVARGQAYLSSGPALELTASSGDSHARMGDELEVVVGTPLQATATWRDAPRGAQLALVCEGEPEAVLTVGTEGTHTWELRRGEARWRLLTLRGGDGQMLALTNPIYFDGRA